jgi:hypothetical protein
MQMVCLKAVLCAHMLQLCMAQDVLQVGGATTGRSQHSSCGAGDVPTDLLDFNLHVDIRTEPALQS